MNLLKPIIPLLLIATASCGFMPKLKTNLSQNEIIAKDFVQGLSKLKGFEPRSTTLQIMPSKSKFNQCLLNELRVTGYGIQTLVKGDNGNMKVKYDVEHYENESGQSSGYRLSIGNIELSREYDTSQDSVNPISAMSVKGVSAPDEVLRFQSAIQVVHAPEPKPEPVILPAQDNQAVELNYSILEEKTLLNSFNSTRIGPVNKQALIAMADNFTPETDIIEILGCSHGGKTKSKNGNQFMAIKRAHRVKEELVYAGIDEQYIHDGGCWSTGTKPPKGHPGRGTKVTHKRISEGL